MFLYDISPYHKPNANRVGALVPHFLHTLNHTDTTSPSLVEFAVTLSEGSTSLTLSFSEAVRATTLDPTAISFTTAPGNTNNTVTLTGVYLRVEESQSIEITLSAADSAALAEAGICLAPQTCFIFFNTNTIQDYNENYVVPILLETALLVRKSD